MWCIIWMLISAAVTPSFCDSLSYTNRRLSAANDWDYIVYTQRWPITRCIEWQAKSTENLCSLPQNNNSWNVHGIWPSKFESEGPFFCNSALHFDPSQLQPMMNELQEYWANIESNTKPNALWKHEWIKHGTCASSLPALNSVTNFFRQGLNWNREYNLSDILAKHNIMPGGNGYNVSDVYDAIKEAVGKNPEIECIVDGKTKQSLISEIRLCFDKNLELIDCTVAKNQISINCSTKKNIMYLATVPNNTETELSKDFNYDYEEPNLVECLEYFNLQSQLLKVYSIIKFLMWFTL